MTSASESAAPREPDSEGCLLITGSYTDVAPAVGSVAMETAARIIMSPALGDFIELRFVDIGPRPYLGAKPTAAVQRIAHELTRPGSGAGQNYFALVIADRSAAAVEQLFVECAADPVVAALPLRYRGLASIEDRLPAAESADEPSPAADIIVSSTGSWSHRDLVDDLRHYAEELMRDFAACQEPGLTSGELDLLRPEDEESVAGESGSAEDDREPGLHLTALAAPDALSPPEKSAVGESGSAESSSEPGPHPAALAAPGTLSQLGELTGPLRSPTPAPTVLSSPTAAEPGRRWIPTLPWRPSRAARQRDDSPAARPEEKPRTSGLVYLILSSDEGQGDRTAWRRGRSVLLQVDEKLAAIPQIAYKVRVLQATGDAATSQLRSAGQLSRHEVKRPPEGTDLARVLSIVQTVMKRDLAALELGGIEVTRPAIVFYAADAPLADAVTAEVYDELAREAFITWVLPELSADLISPAFADDACIILDHQAVADEVITILLRSMQGTREGGRP